MIDFTHLWWVFRTQGNADTMEMPTATLVMTPMISTESWFFLWSMKMTTRRQISQINPDVAHPECMPPRCWSIDVQARRKPRGVHCEQRISPASKSRSRSAYVCKKGINDQIEEASKEFIPHKNGDQ